MGNSNQNAFVVEQIKDYVTAHLQDNITASDIAKAAAEKRQIGLWQNWILVVSD